jgi:1,2-diacylglycerol 3-alpha-glucosyltransferase
MPDFEGSREDVVHVPSLPLPLPTSYRLTIPLGTRERITRELGPLSVVHTHSPFVTGWMGARYARRLNVPLVFTYHTQLGAYAHYVPFDANTTRRAAERLTRTFANNADAVIVPTSSMERHLRSLGVKRPIAVVPTCIDVDRFAGGVRRADLRERYGVGRDGEMILCVGRLAREKNLDLTLRAFAALEVPRARLVLVGDGPEREHLEHLAAALGIAARTHFTGELPRSMLPDAYASADLFLFTSRTETQGLVLVEALAAGLPIVAVDAPQTRDVLGTSGRFTPPDPLALAAAVAAVLPDASSGRDGRRSAARRFDRPEAGASVLDLYRELIDGRTN